MDQPTRERLIDAAAELLDRGGRTSVTLRKVGRAAGVSTLDGTLLDVIRQAQATSLSDVVTSEGSLPGVRGDFLMTPGAFDRFGARRLVCLTDGSTLSEQILELESTPALRVFTYVAAVPVA